MPAGTTQAVARVALSYFDRCLNKTVTTQSFITLPVAEEVRIERSAREAWIRNHIIPAAIDTQDLTTIAALESDPHCASLQAELADARQTIANFQAASMHEQGNMQVMHQRGRRGQRWGSSIDSFDTTATASTTGTGTGATGEQP